MVLAARRAQVLSFVGDVMVIVSLTEYTRHLERSRRIFRTGKAVGMRLGSSGRFLDFARNDSMRRWLPVFGSARFTRLSTSDRSLTACAGGALWYRETRRPSPQPSSFGRLRTGYEAGEGALPAQRSHSLFELRSPVEQFGLEVSVLLYNIRRGLADEHGV